MQSTLKKGVDFQAPDGDGMASQEREKHFHGTKNKGLHDICHASP
jgi:hypothetical protein